MSSPDYYLCDRCGRPTKNRQFFATGNCMDGAGSRCDEGDTLDICGECAWQILRGLLKYGGETHYDVGKRIIHIVRCDKNDHTVPKYDGWGKSK